MNIRIKHLPLFASDKNFEEMFDIIRYPIILKNNNFLSDI